MQSLPFVHTTGIVYLALIMPDYTLFRHKHQMACCYNSHLIFTGFILMLTTRLNTAIYKFIDMHLQHFCRHLPQVRISAPHFEFQGCRF